MSPDERCEECGVFFHGGLHCHNPTCSQQKIEDYKINLKKYYDAWLELTKKNDNYRRHLSRQVQFLEGKLAIVKNENNQLRKKLYDK